MKLIDKVLNSVYPCGTDSPDANTEKQRIKKLIDNDILALKERFSINSRGGEYENLVEQIAKKYENILKQKELMNYSEHF